MNNLSIKLKVSKEKAEEIKEKGENDPKEALEEVLKMMEEQIKDAKVPNQKDIIEHAKISPNKFIYNTKDSFRKYCLRDSYHGFGNVYQTKNHGDKKANAELEGVNFDMTDKKQQEEAFEDL